MYFFVTSVQDINNVNIENVILDEKVLFYWIDYVMDFRIWRLDIRIFSSFEKNSLDLWIFESLGLWI